MNDPGEACLVGDANDIQAWDTDSTTLLAADSPATVVVVISDCTSGSVDWPERTCDAVLTGSDLQISAFAKSKTPLGAITADCNFVTVTCQTPVLAAGEYAVRYGGASETVVLPYEGPAICL